MSPRRLRNRKRKIVVESSSSSINLSSEDEGEKEETSIKLSALKSTWALSKANSQSTTSIKSFDYFYQSTKEPDWIALHIHKRKLDELEAWIKSFGENSGVKKHLVVSGPSGCGKSTAIMAGFRRYSIFPFDGYTLDLYDLLPSQGKNTRTKFPPLSFSPNCSNSSSDDDDNDKIIKSPKVADCLSRIILFDDLPNEEAYKKIDAILQNGLLGETIFVFIITVPCNPLRSVGDDPLWRKLVASPSVLHIQFNPLAKVALRKLAMPYGEVPSEEATGDGRSILIDLIWNQMMKEHIANEMTFRRDAKLAFFHELGKILYGKTQWCESERTLDINDLLLRIPFLFTNYPQFILRQKAWPQIAEAFSIADAVEWRVRMSEMWDHALESLPEQIIHHEASLRPSSGFKQIVAPPSLHSQNTPFSASQL